MTTAKQETIPLHRGSFIATARYQLREKLENKRFYRSSSDVIALFYVIWIVIKMVTHFIGCIHYIHFSNRMLQRCSTALPTHLISAQE